MSDVVALLSTHPEVEEILKPALQVDMDVKSIPPVMYLRLPEELMKRRRPSLM